jgi:hypothetical protein
VNGLKQAQPRRGGRFFGPRVNCEDVPCLPAEAVAWVLNDPRELPYLMVWQDRDGGGIRDAVRVARYSEPPGRFDVDWAGWIKIKRPDGTYRLVRTVERPLPRNGGKALLIACPVCRSRVRALYGWRTNRSRTHSTYAGRWECRMCAGLRYSSEGGALVVRSRGSLARLVDSLCGLNHQERPLLWYPCVFSDPEDARWLGVKGLG